MPTKQHATITQPYPPSGGGSSRGSSISSCAMTPSFAALGCPEDPSAVAALGVTVPLFPSRSDIASSSRSGLLKPGVLAFTVSEGGSDWEVKGSTFHWGEGRGAGAERALAMFYVWQKVFRLHTPFVHQRTVCGDMYDAHGEMSR